MRYRVGVLALTAVLTLTITVLGGERAAHEAALDPPTADEINSGSRSINEIPRAMRYPVVVVGQSLADARKALEADGMGLVEVKHRYTRLHPKGEVVAQYNLNRDEVVLVLSMGPPPHVQVVAPGPAPAAVFSGSNDQGRVSRRAATNNWFDRVVEYYLHDRLSTELLIYDYFGWITYQEGSYHQIIGFAGGPVRTRLPCGSVIVGVRESGEATVQPLGDAVEEWALLGAPPEGTEVELIAYKPTDGRWEGPISVKGSTGRATQRYDFRVNLVNSPYTPPVITESDKREIEGKQALVFNFCTPEWMPSPVLGPGPAKT